MNDEPASSSSRVANELPPDNALQHDEAPTAAQIKERRKKNREMFNKKRGQLLDDLLYNLDVLVYAQLSAIYYMDCSFLRFLIRALVHFVLLTPKPATFAQPPDQQPFVGAVLGMNFICIALHLWLSPATGTEATRGYLHGGMAMDFIGQKGPTSRVVLVLLDMLVLALQLVHLTAHISRKRLKDGASATATTTTTSTQAQQTAPTPSRGQDLDSEERGIRHSAELEQQDDIEMQTLNPSGSHSSIPTSGIPTSATTAETEASASASAEATTPPNSRAALLSPTPPPQTDIHIFEAFHSGQIVLADLNLWQCVKEQFWAYQKSSAAQREARTAGYRAQLTSRLFDMGIARFAR
ncbi:hypothetical protein Q7P37_011538 [Cladosporium fusiforme]